MLVFQFDLFERNLIKAVANVYLQQNVSGDGNENNSCCLAQRNGKAGVGNLLR